MAAVSAGAKRHQNIKLVVLGESWSLIVEPGWHRGIRAEEDCDCTHEVGIRILGEVAVSVSENKPREKERHSPAPPTSKSGLPSPFTSPMAKEYCIAV